MYLNRYRVTPGGGLFLFALTLTGAAAFLSGNNLLFLIFAAMIALLLVSGFLSRLVLAGLELELLLPAHLSARTPAAARVRIRNLKRLTPSFSIELSGKVLTAPIYFPVIPGHAMVEAAADVIFPFRGRHPENVFLISTRFPFGFIRKSAAVALRHETVVYPALEADPELDLIADRLSGVREAALRGRGQDFYRIRPYDGSDDARHVDWKSTAHTGALQVREFARERDRGIEICFDRRMGPDEQTQFERMIERSAYLAWRLAADRNELIFRSQDFFVIVPENGEIYDILRFLSLTEPLYGFSGNDRHLEFPIDDANLQIVFSISPDRSRDSGERAGERFHFGAH